MKKRYALVFESRYGQTRTITKFIKQKIFELAKEEVNIDLYEISDRAPHQKFNPATDFVIIGAPVYVGKFPDAIVNWVRAHQIELGFKSSAFFSVSLNAADPRPEARLADDELLKKFLKITKLHPKYVASLAGAIKFSEYGWFKRYLLKRISGAVGGPTDTSHDCQMTDWSQVEAFVRAIVDNDHQSVYSTSSRFRGKTIADLNLLS